VKLVNLTKDSNIYTSNVHFLLGDWKAIDDVNALIDVGRTPFKGRADVAVSRPVV